MTRAWPSTLRVLATKRQSSGTHHWPRDEPLISARIARLRPSTSAHCDGRRSDRGAGDEEAVVRHASLAARRAVDLGSHREAAAQYERALRWAAQAAPSALAEL